MLVMPEGSDTVLAAIESSPFMAAAMNAATIETIPPRKNRISRITRLPPIPGL